MNIEGIELELSAEIVRSTSTGLLFLLGMYWLIYAAHRVWRQLLWEEGVVAWQALQQPLGGHLVGRRAGWRIRGARGDLEVRGGLRPVRSRLALPDGRVHHLEGMATPAWVLGHLAGPTEAASPVR